MLPPPYRYRLIISRMHMNACSAGLQVLLPSIGRSISIITGRSCANGCPTTGSGRFHFTTCSIADNIRRLVKDTRVLELSMRMEEEKGSDESASVIDKYLVDWTKSYGIIPQNSSVVEGGGSATAAAREVGSSEVIVCLPKTRDDVSAILKYCNSEGIQVVPQGGNTGLVGGGVPRASTYYKKNMISTTSSNSNSNSNSNKSAHFHGEKRHQVLLSLARMDRIIELDEDSSIVTCESGVILENLNNFCKEKGLMVPLDLGAKGSCHIGGNVSTNAGGLRVLRYGSMFQNVIGLEVVLPNGDVLDMLRKVRKDNSGYHLKNIFIGSEGTLGIVTKVSLALVAQPQQSKVILLKLNSFEKVSRLLRTAKSMLAEVISAFEFMDINSLESIRQIYPDIFARIPADWMEINRSSGAKDQSTGIGACVVLMELSGGAGALSEDRIQSLLTTLLDDSMIEDGLISGDSKQESLFWSIRENVPVALMAVSRLKLIYAGSTHSSASGQFGKLFKYDISLALRDMDGLVPFLAKRLMELNYRIFPSPSAEIYKNTNTNIPITTATTRDVFSSYSNINATTNSSTATATMKHEHYGFQICCFGHAGDQNLHLNMLFRPIFPQASSNDDNSPMLPAPALSGDDIRAIQADLDELIYRFTSEVRGSISAEHGVGQSKVALLPTYKTPVELATMRQLKNLFDPNNILNPGKVVDMDVDMDMDTNTTVKPVLDDSNTPIVDVWECIVPHEWTDYNGHTNDSRYSQMSSEASDNFFRSIGFNESYLASGRSFYTVESHIRFLEQTYAGDRLKVTVQVTSYDEKRIHIFSEIIRQDGVVAATVEYLVLHVDTTTEKASPMGKEVFDLLLPIAEAHAKLSIPTGFGRSVGQRPAR